MIIISLCITIWTLIEPPVIETTLEVDIKPIYNIRNETDKDGNVKVYVK